MKTLYESILDDDDDILDDNYTIKVMKAEKWLEDNCIIDGTYNIDKSGNINVNGSISIKPAIHELPYQFGIVTGDFCADMTMSYQKNLTSLKNMPIQVRGDVFLNYGEFETLEGLTQNIDGRLSLINCKKLKSLEGCPKKLHQFIIRWCNITSLKGCPQDVDDFVCSCCNKLTDLTGAPKKVKYGFDANSCLNLSSLKGAPIEVGHNFNIYGCNSLYNLTGLPKKIGGWLNCADCKGLENIKSILKSKIGTIDFSGCHGLNFDDEILTYIQTHTESDSVIVDYSDYKKEIIKLKKQLGMIK